MLSFTTTKTFLVWVCLARCIRSQHVVPPPPAPEPIAIIELPLPPAVATTAVGACTRETNPHGTGCISANGTFQSGDFLPDGKHVVASVTFSGAPAAPDPASIYNGPQIIIVKTDGTLFGTGDPWKCITCGVPEANAVGITNDIADYPQAFRDGRRLLVGTNIVDCGVKNLVSDDCAPKNTYIYPLRLNGAADGSGPGVSIRELRLHPDQVHIEFNAFSTNRGSLSQFGYFGRLSFNTAPATGMPKAPRYDITNVTRLYNSNATRPITTNGDRLIFNPGARQVGEARGFNGDGTELTYIGYSTESCNIDIFAVHLITGAVRRLTSHPEYCDPVSFSPNNEWMAIMDTRGSGRNMFIAGMRGIPPIVDIIATTLPASTRNNGDRRFFQPYLLDFYGDRDNYYGQKINGGNDGTEGSNAVNDPQWNGRADPRWSPDSTQVVFWQAQAVSPACGGYNPLPCYPSFQPGGRTYRMYLATFTSRTPSAPALIIEHQDSIPWGTPYIAGEEAPVLPQPAAGLYTMDGKISGCARINITWLDAPEVGDVSVVYNNYSDDGVHFIHGSESVKLTQLSPTVSHYDWYSNITQSGAVTGTKLTSDDGYHVSIDVLENVLVSNGTMITTLDGVQWRNPLSRT